MSLSSINVILPMAGGSESSEPGLPPYPKALIEICGTPMIQCVIENLKTIGDHVHFVFIVLKQDCLRFHLDNTLRLVAGDNCTIIRLEKPTKGAACSVLMAIKHVNNSLPMVIANSDQIFECDLREKMGQFKAHNSDAGCLYIQSVHPHWSYVHLEEGRVIEAAEKNPISKNAIAGFYYYKEGKTFVRAAQKMILNGANVGGSYYVAPIFNEVLLEDKRVDAIFIEEGQYHSFYTPRRIEDYERKLGQLLG